MIKIEIKQINKLFKVYYLNWKLNRKEEFGYAKNLDEMTEIVKNWQGVEKIVYICEVKENENE